MVYSFAQANGYVVIERGGDYRVLATTNLVNGLPQVHSYTELATGMNYTDGSGQLTEAQEQIVLQPDGSAAATQGRHQVHFPGDIYEGVLQLTLPDGRHLTSRPLGLSYDDGSNTLFLATLTNAVGELAGSNQVIYPNAFSGLKADLRYTYTRAGFEQDVILRQQPPTPETLGLNPDTARLQVLTEFFSPPEPAIQANSLPAQTGLALADQGLDFGTMQMGAGRTFLLGRHAPETGVAVAKHWIEIHGRQFLVEEVPVNAIADGLANLPMTALNGKTGSAPLFSVGQRNLPPQRPAKPGAQPMLLAQARPSAPGYVLDYQILNPSLTNYVFNGDTTYYLSGNVSLAGTNTFEGGTVIKYAVNKSLAFASGAKAVFNTGPYLPAIFTAEDDNTVGEVVSGSTGTPSGFYAINALSFSSSTTQLVSGVRFLYANTAIAVAHTPLNLWNAQFVNCYYGVNATGGTVNQVNNALFWNVAAEFSLANNDGTSLSANQSTFYAAYKLAEVTTTDSTNILNPQLRSQPLMAPPHGAYVYLTNCILASVTNDANVTAAGYNGFFQASMFGDSPVTNNFYPFQTVGAGNAYLANGVSYFNYGTPSLAPALLLDLATKTTYPPLIESFQTNISDTTLPPQATRDIDTPDLGYHYDPVDYLTENYSMSGATLSLAGGVVIACYDDIGIELQDGSAINSVGSPALPNWLVHYLSVQEQPVFCGIYSNYFEAQNCSAINGGGVPANGMFQFTKFARPAGYGWHFYDRDNYSYGSLLVQDCELWSGYNDFSGTNNVATTVENSLFARSAIFADDTLATNYSVAFSNNLCWHLTNGTSYVFFYRAANSLWTLFNNDFDGCAITVVGTSTVNGCNAYLNCGGLDGRLYPTNSFDIVRTNSLAYQTGPLGGFCQPTNSPLIDAGSTTATGAGLDSYTVLTNQTPDSSTVDIGYHYFILTPPTAYNATYSPCPNTPMLVTLSGYSPNNSYLIYRVLTYPAHGTLSGTAANLTYTPYSCYEGPDSFTFKVNDGFLDSAPATITLTTGDAVHTYYEPNPVLTCRNTPISITLVAYDDCGEDSSTFSYAVLANPTNGVLSGTMPNLTYAPSNANFTGVDSFTYKASTVCGNAVTNTVTITVAGAPAVIPAPIRSGFDQNIFFQNDDASTNVPSIPLTINFYGAIFSSLYVNENGNITFNAPFDSSVGSICYNPSTSIAETAADYGLNIIAPFWGDVDTRGQCSAPVTYGTNTVSGHIAFGVNWAYVGYYSEQVNKLNAFQLILIDRSDVAVGDFDLEFNYDQIQWESGAASGGPNGLGGDAARVGFASPNNSGFEFNGSGVVGALLDTNAVTGLITNSFNSSALGRYVFQFRNGFPLGHP
jgi:hypothetical protein